MDGNTPQLLSISAFARRVGLAPSALRFYDDCGVLPPAHVDGTSGYRFYRPAQEKRAILLRELREADVPLPDVAVVLDGPREQAQRVLHGHLRRMLDRTERGRSAIEEILRSLTVTGTRAEARVGGAELASAIRQVVPATASDEDFPALGCVLVELGDGEVRLVATDRYRLSIRVLHPAAMHGDPRRILVRAADLVEIGPWAARNAEVTVEVDGEAARLRGAGECRVLTLFEDRFPSYREALAALGPPECRMIVDRLAFRDALFSLGDTSYVTVSTAGDGLAVTVSTAGDGRAVPGGTAEGGSAARAGTGRDDPAATVAAAGDRTVSTASDAVRLGAICSGPPLRIAFDTATLIPALEAGVGPDVLLEVSTATHPVIVRSADQGSFTTLVMPVALPPSLG
ncbi:MerR family transcriptional regulator [Streptosporangium roseum]|uniref:Transcriptional regulator, MerR family n=1 Tax=Streptosporangium roseum (strain ATCC 12428 / DSM 43021 / JCM 3005 / KCTC 9067 / NCIMB 10171 / NRRL 2505 / NI 9100) TaxID=479432 RepID=D2AZP7_STRRD|nr:MerR family transcriptional regulator [Streptosporangium roseum]ACZ85292.1 putative transcriptional regulator, MerR family [Streptosporangium roseum DSM 43021]